MILDALVLCALLLVMFYPITWMLGAAAAMTHTIYCACGKQQARSVVCAAADVADLQSAMTKNCPWCSATRTETEAVDV